LNEDNFTFLHVVYSFLFAFNLEEEVKTTLLGYIFFSWYSLFQLPMFCFVLCFYFGMPNKHKCLSQRRATISYKLLASEKK